MKKRYPSLSIFYVLLLLNAAIFQGCIKDKIDLNKSGNNSISPQLAGALIYSSITIKDIMNNTNKNGQLTTDSTGFITLVYKGNLFSLKAADVLTIPTPQPAVSATTNLSVADVTAINLLGTGNSITISDSSLVNFQTGGQAQIDVLNCKTANLSFNLNYTIKQDANIKITIPGATLNGIAFTQTIPITYTGSPVNISNNYSLNGYTINMTNGNTTHDVIKIKYDITVIKTPNTSTVGEGVSFSETFSNVTYNSIIGYLGSQSLSPNTDTIPITIFQNSLLNAGATFHILNPLLKVYLTNSYGLPIGAHFNTFEGYTPGSAPMPITGAPNPINIPLPITIGQSAEDSFSLNKNNSNIFTLINQLPKNVIYNVTAISNPSGTVYTNFITDTSQFKIDMELDLPLEGTASNFLFQDTVAYSFNLNTDQVKSITVRAYIDNGFPVDVNMRLAFVDSAYNVIDELINPMYQLVMPSASIGATGMVSSPTPSSHDFTIPSSVIPQLNKVKHILIGAVVNTTNGGNTNVKLYDFYHLDVKMGVNVQLYLKF